MDEKQIDQILGDLVGGDFDPTFLVNLAAEGAKAGIAEKQKSDAASAAKQDAEARAQRAIAADVAATEACAQVEIAQRSAKPDATTIAAKQAVAAQASMAQDTAAAGLPPAAAEKRVAAANEALKKANAEWSNEPGSVAKAARARCAQATVIKAQGGAVTPSMLPQEPPKPSFFKRMLGPLPVWGWGLAGGGVAALAAGAVMLFRRKRR